MSKICKNCIHRYNRCKNLNKEMWRVEESGEVISKYEFIKHDLFDYVEKYYCCQNYIGVVKELQSTISGQETVKIKDNKDEDLIGREVLISGVDKGYIVGYLTSSVDTSLDRNQVLRTNVEEKLYILNLNDSSLHPIDKVKYELVAKVVKK